MAFTAITILEGGLKLTNRYNMRDLLYFIKRNKHEKKRRSVPVLPWLLDMAFEDKEHHFPDKDIERIDISKGTLQI